MLFIAIEVLRRTSNLYTHCASLTEVLVPAMVENLMQSFINTEAVLQLVGTHWRDFVGPATAAATTTAPLKVFYGVSQGGIFGAGFSGQFVNRNHLLHSNISTVLTTI
jgi:phosphopantothenoylcysteine synthetase/decarboxylase